MFWLGKSVEVVPSEGGKSDKKREKINLSPLEVLILAQLRSRELRNNGEPVGQYGYEMIQDLNKLFAGSWEAKSGTIYPILSKLEGKKQMIVGSRKKSPLGPVKKVYNLLERGRKAIDEIILHNFEGDLDFILQYLNLISPFLIKIDEKDQNDEIFSKLTTIPARVANIGLEKPKTLIDQTLRRKKLEALQESFKLSLQNIEEEINKSNV
ncbi:MAG: PadR family transcriptional regulator [Candidatus Lokiarchaeota archaeon]|nr:PadR family transcriptional regulator [Candidatus Harpocratesius repetitus]